MTTPISPVPNTSLHRTIENLGFALGFIEDEREANRRAPLGAAAGPSPPYRHLETAVVDVIEAARKSVPPTDGSIGFRSFSDEPTAIFYGTLSGGHLACFSCRDGHFPGRLDDIRKWPATEPTGALLCELAENFWPVKDESREAGAADRPATSTSEYGTWSAYSFVTEAAAERGWTEADQGIRDDQDRDTDALEWLRERTTVIELEDGGILLLEIHS